MSFNLRLRIAALIFMFSTAIVGLVGRHIFATAWSNKCDPGNAQFYLLKNDPVASYRAAGEMYTWEVDSPDNSWLCSGPHLSLDHVGRDVKAMFEATRSNLAANGWIEVAPQPNEDFAFFQKDKDGQHLTADVSQQAFWVEV